LTLTPNSSQFTISVTAALRFSEPDVPVRVSSYFPEGVPEEPLVVVPVTPELAEPALGVMPEGEN